jgi:hypothetical protein
MLDNILVLLGRESFHESASFLERARHREAKAVIRDVASYEKTLALLKFLALGTQQAERGELTPGLRQRSQIVSGSKPQCWSGSRQGGGS